MVATVHKVKADPDWLEFLNNNFEYGDVERTQQVDLIAYDQNRQKLIALEIKRGYGGHDAGKKKKILQEILATRLLLKSYGTVKVDSSAAYICSYYGSQEFNTHVAIDKDGLNELFQVDALAPVEEVNHYYRKRIRALAEEWLLLSDE